MPCVEVVQGQLPQLERGLFKDTLSEIIVHSYTRFLLLAHPSRPVQGQLTEVAATGQNGRDVVRIAEGIDMRERQRAQMRHWRQHNQWPRVTARREADPQMLQSRQLCEANINRFQHFGVQLPAEALQIRHAIDRRTHRDVQHHGRVRHASEPREFLQLRLLPFALQDDAAYQGRIRPRDQGIQTHGKRAGAAPTLGLIIAKPNAVVEAQGDVAIELRQRHVMQRAACPAEASQVCGIVDLMREKAILSDE